MKIKLNEKYRLFVQDSENIVLELGRVNGNTKKEYWRGVRFYSSLRQAFKDVLDNSRIVMDIKTKKEHYAWMRHIKNIASEINNI